MRSSSSSSIEARRDPAHQVHGVLGPEGERHAEELAVAPQQVGEDLFLVLLGGGHELRLVPQRALLEREPDRDEVLLLALEAEIPLERRGAVGHLLALGCHQRSVGGQLARRPGVDAGDGRGHLVVGGAGRRSARFGERLSSAACGATLGRGAQPHSTSRPEASSSCNSTSVRAAARQV